MKIHGKEIYSSRQTKQGLLHIVCLHLEDSLPFHFYIILGLFKMPYCLKMLFIIVLSGIKKLKINTIQTAVEVARSHWYTSEFISLHSRCLEFVCNKDPCAPCSFLCPLLPSASPHSMRFEPSRNNSSGNACYAGYPSACSAGYEFIC